jgi:Zn-dependent protease
VLFNLIPLPPFDGYNAIEPFLPPAIRMQMNSIRDMAIWIVLLAFWFVPFIGDFFWGSVIFFSTALGVDWNLAMAGLRGFRFWEL